MSGFTLLKENLSCRELILSVTKLLCPAEFRLRHIAKQRHASNRTLPALCRRVRSVNEEKLAEAGSVFFLTIFPTIHS